MLALFRGSLVLLLLLLPLSALRASDLETVLKEWESAAARIRRLDCEFRRFKYDYAFETETRATGSLAVVAGRAFYQVRPIAARPNGNGGKLGRNGRPFTLCEDCAERWYWTGDCVIQVDDGERTFQEFALDLRTGDCEFRPEPPALPEDGTSPCSPPERPADRVWPKSVGEAIIGLVAGIAISAAFQEANWAKSFHDSIQEFWLARPFLLGMSAGELRQRFHIQLVTQSDHEVRLKFEPKAENDRALYTQAILILTKNEYEPRALKMIHDDGNETVHLFENLRVNSRGQDFPFRDDPLSRPDLRGYRSLNP